MRVCVCVGGNLMGCLWHVLRIIFFKINFYFVNYVYV